MASTLGIIWARILHDLALYEHEFTLREVTHERQFTQEGETPEEEEERLHTEVGGLSEGPQL